MICKMRLININISSDPSARKVDGHRVANSQGVLEQEWRVSIY